ncbi:MAG: hypothetical protein AB8B95_08870 [Pseudohongiellaceae bacterium]
MLAEFIDTSSWTPEQWLAAIILAFIVVTILVVLKRLMGLFKLSQKRQYKPNLRPLRRKGHRPPDPKS